MVHASSKRGRERRGSAFFAVRSSYNSSPGPSHILEFRPSMFWHFRRGVCIPFRFVFGFFKSLSSLPPPPHQVNFWKKKNDTNCHTHTHILSLHPNCSHGVSASL
ncbi:hypothetical protein D8B26_002555 [Coccidioides posadasii str. Silveira]|uniref:uncharacterized protein n=1 Tax=Coccidioides posadasii (strain RMSCC 757 / Silveira) TaxID=443226 RepID=UPI001BEF68EE|nr:hypothetical protein D8B26_002555 [Coccidioides posadasii str. Silveira]